MAAQVQQDIIPSDTSANPGSSESFKPASSNSNPNLKRIYIVFGVIFVVVLGGLLFLLFSQKIIKAPAELKTPAINFEEVNFPSTVWRDRIYGNVNAAAEEQDGERRFELYKQVFIDLVAIYVRDHDAATKLKAQELAQFISGEFPDFYNPSDFSVPCLDLACGAMNYPPEIEEVKGDLDKIASIEPLVVESVLKKFEAAALSSDVDLQWQNYFTAFREILSAKKVSGEVESIAVKLNAFLKTNYKGNYELIERVKPELLKI